MWYARWASGWKLSAGAAQALEARLVDHPEELEARVALRVVK